MDKHPKKEKKACQNKENLFSWNRSRLPEIAEKIIENVGHKDGHTHIDYDPIPSNDAVIKIINKFREVIFPGYFSTERIDPANLKYVMGQTVSTLFDMLSAHITNCFHHDCFRYDHDCVDCQGQGQDIALDILNSVPSLRKTISLDVAATYNGDPAAKSHDEIIFSYPGIFAIMIHRIAHELFNRKVPLLPRGMAEQAHSVTGIDIHPGARIDHSFVIDHGAGVVIGETSEIGKNVRIYQGVTLGALSLPPDAGETLRNKKRHPTIEDDVIIYAGATILGGETVIGKGAIIGGNVWLTDSVPPDARVFMKKPELIFKPGQNE